MAAAPISLRITFTFDLEDHRASRTGVARYPEMTRHILDFLDERQINGTFFVVGTVAAEDRELVRDIARRGHEVASHSYEHVPLTEVEPTAFHLEVRRARLFLQDITGQPIRGFRAPFWSLTPATLWAADALREAGFSYSSSVLPASSFLHGFPSAPQRPFIWPSGLLEIPCPLGRIGPLALPFLGGMYLRYLPPWRFYPMLRRVPNHGVWTYCHPYDFDTKEPFNRAAGSGLLASVFLWCNRRHTLRRLDRILKGFTAVTFAARLEELMHGAVDFPALESADWPSPWPVNA